MDVKDLNFVVALYETRNFSVAARKRGTVQSNVSARIRNLEKSLGVILFERLWRTVAPTTQGTKLYRGARRLLRLLSEAERAVKGRPSRGQRPSRRARSPRR